jgi:hypothetical protein
VLAAWGCARAPIAPTGADARARLLDTLGQPEPSTRGGGKLSAERFGKKQGSLKARWAALDDSLVLVGYAGPVRALDASILGDSVYAAIRPYDLGIAGVLPGGEGLGAPGLRFLARPWDFGSAWVREGIGRARVAPSSDGWLVHGELDGSDGPHPFTLELSRRSEPKLLRIEGRAGDSRSVSVRYGPMRRFSGGRAPRWIEWTHGGSEIRLELEDYERTQARSIKHAPPADADWTILALDSPRGRDLICDFIGCAEERASP